MIPVRFKPVAVISHGFWQQHFASAPDAIGRTLTLDGVSFTIVGVTPPGFFGVDVGRAFDVAVPIATEPRIHGRESWLSPGSLSTPLLLMARLKPTQSFSGATAALRGVQRQIRDATLPRQWPRHLLDRYLTDALTLVPALKGNSTLRRDLQRPLLTISIVVALVLLIACANIANVLLARGAARRQELSLRRALGGSRWRIVRQLLMESAVLAIAGSAGGLFVAVWVSRIVLTHLSTQGFDAGPNVTTTGVYLDLSLDRQVLTFSVVTTLVTALISGLIPALWGSRLSAMDVLTDRGRITPDARHARAGHSLVVAQVAVSLMLLVGAGLFARTLTVLSTRPLGFRPNGVLVIDVDTQRAHVPPSGRVILYQRIRDAVRSVPGVTGVGFAVRTPTRSAGPMLGQPITEVSGGEPLPPQGRLSLFNTISDGWFDALGTHLVGGRDISEHDRRSTPPVAIVNQAFARTFLNGANPVGHTATLLLPGSPPPPVEIVGLVADGVYGSVRTPVQPTIYLPMAQLSDSFLPFLTTASLAVQVDGGTPHRLVKSVTTAILGVNPELPLTVETLHDQIARSLTQERLLAIVSEWFGAFALVLAALGLYGVTAYAVSRRRQEIGIRVALGAVAANVVRLVMSSVLLPVGIGVAVGAILSVWASGFVATLLYGVQPRDSSTLTASVVVLILVATLAAGFPAWRASRIDPASVLREQ